MRNKKLIVLFSVLIGITLLAVFNSVLFSVQHVNAYCANREESVYIQDVLAAHKIKKGTSIFLVNKKKVTARVQAGVPQVRVLNIEKKFPNRIWINYIEESEYLQVTRQNKTYYLGKDLRVMRISDSVGGGDPIFLSFADELSALSVGDTVSFSAYGKNGTALIAEIFDGFSRLGYDDTTIDILYKIDLSGDKAIFTLAIKSATGKSAGMEWSFESVENMANKIRLAMTVYSSDKLTDEQKKRGRLILTSDKAMYKGIDGGVTDVTPA